MLFQSKIDEKIHSTSVVHNLALPVNSYTHESLTLSDREQSWLVS